MIAFILGCLILVAYYVIKDRKYKNGAYYQATKLPYSAVRFDTGRYGEYLTYMYLKKFEKSGAKFLFNCYLPKANGETTEIDVLMICRKGIFVIESKNYSGWIFGSDSQKYWYQTLPAGRGRSHKEHFYNPIMQNHAHIKHLQAFLGKHVPMWNMVVFSDRCTLKSIHFTGDNISVINRYNIGNLVSAIYDQRRVDYLCDDSISDIYNKLYPFTQVNDAVKSQHITNIHKW